MEDDRQGWAEVGCEKKLDAGLQRWNNGKSSRGMLGSLIYATGIQQGVAGPDGLILHLAPGLGKELASACQVRHNRDKQGMSITGK